MGGDIILPILYTQRNVVSIYVSFWDAECRRGDPLLLIEPKACTPKFNTRYVRAKADDN